MALLLAPEELRGRVLGVLMLSIGVLPLAMLAQGAIAGAVGVIPTTLAAGLLLVASMVALAALIPGMLRLR